MDFSMAYLVNFYWAQIFSRKNPKYKMVNRWRIYNRTVNNLLETVNPEPLFLSWPNLTRFYLVKRENVFAPEMSEKLWRHKNRGNAKNSPKSQVDQTLQTIS